MVGVIICLILCMCTGIHAILLLRQNQTIKSLIGEKNFNTYYASCNLYLIGLEWILNCMLVGFIFYFGVYSKLISLINVRKYFSTYCFFFWLVMAQYALLAVMRLLRILLIDKPMSHTQLSTSILFSSYLKKILISVVFLQTWILSIILISLNGSYTLPIAWAISSFFYFGYEVIYPMVMYRLFYKTNSIDSIDGLKCIRGILKKYFLSDETIQILPASKSTWHVNASAVGFGQNQKIILFDSLFRYLSLNQIKGVLVHEIAHVVHKDFMKQQILVFWLITCGFCLDYIFFKENLLFGMGIFILCRFIVQFLLNPVYCYFSRQREFAADMFAQKEGFAEALMDAIIIIEQHNSTLIKPDPWFLFWYFTHPPVQDRIIALNIHMGWRYNLNSKK